MSRLTKREIEEIRRVKRAVCEEAREEFSRVRLADDADTRQPMPAARLLGLLARHSGLAEIAWMVRHWVILPLRQRSQARRAIDQLHALNDHALRDIGIERGEIETIADRIEADTPPDPRPVVGPFAALRRRITRRRAINQLQALDDRMLEDIGLVRAHIADFVNDIDRAVVAGRIEGMTAARRLRTGKSAVQSLKQWNLSRQAAGDMARLDPEALADLGYLKGDVDWVPEVLAERKLNAV